MKLVAIPHLPPFCCGKCGATEGTRDYWIDTDIDAEVPSHADGRIFICNKCILDLAEIDPQIISRVDSDKLLAYQNEFVLKAQETQRAWEEVVNAFGVVGIDLVKVWELSGFNRDNKLIASSIKHNSNATGNDSISSSSKPNSVSLLSLD